MRLARRGPFGAIQLLVMVGLVVAGGLLTAPGAGATPGRPQVLRVRWHLFANERPFELISNGRFVFVQFNLASGRAVLIDDQTGRRTRLQAPIGCADPIAGGPWLLFHCVRRAGPLTLYHVSPPRGWRTLAPSEQLVEQCNSPDVGDCQPTAIGSHWVEWETTTCEDFGVHCSSPHYEFQNIDTGQLAANPASVGGTVIPDLNSPTLARKLCSPLRVPSAGQSIYDPGPIPGTVTLYGRFAVLSKAGVDAGLGSANLQKCGSRLDRQLLSESAAPYPQYAPPVGNNQVVVWARGVTSGQPGNQLNAVLLPSLRRLVIPVPAAIGASSTLLLGPRHLYMIGGHTQDLYTTPSRTLTKPRTAR